MVETVESEKLGDPGNVMICMIFSQVELRDLISKVFFAAVNYKLFRSFLCVEWSI